MTENYDEDENSVFWSEHWKLEAAQPWDAADMGYPWALCAIGKWYEIEITYEDALEEGDNYNLDVAYENYERSALGGYAEAQFLLGLMYLEYKTTIIEPQEGIKWLLLAAQQGHRNSQRYLGVLYCKGEMVGRDLVSSYVWSKLARDQSEDPYQTVLDGELSLEELWKTMSPSERLRAERRIRNTVIVENRFETLRDYSKRYIFRAICCHCDRYADLAWSYLATRLGWNCHIGRVSETLVCSRCREHNATIRLIVNRNYFLE